MDPLRVGTEIVECARVRAMIEEHGEKFLRRVYTDDEIRWCQSRKSSTEQFAAVWAVKEAVFKCLRIVGRANAPWAQVETEMSDEGIRVRLLGSLRERMTDAGLGTIAVSAAFTRHYATATAIASRGT